MKKTFTLNKKLQGQLTYRPDLLIAYQNTFSVKPLRGTKVGTSHALDFELINQMTWHNEREAFSQQRQFLGSIIKGEQRRLPQAFTIK
jgi:hypothetical protein